MNQQKIAADIHTELTELNQVLVKSHLEQFCTEIGMLEELTENFMHIQDPKQANKDLLWLIERIYALTEKIESHKEAVFKEIAYLKKSQQVTKWYRQESER